jgi:cell division protein FtsL
MKHIRIIGSILCPIAALLLLVGEIIYSNELICGTNELAQIDSTITTLDDKNRALSQQIAQLSSLTIIEKKAGELGFIPTQKILTLSSEGAPVAYQYK